MEDKKDPPADSAWTHGAKVGVGPVREAVQATRDAVASALDELQRELRKKRAFAAQFGRR